MSAETFTFEGVEFDLTISYADTIGVEWTWANAWTAAGEPLMRTLGMTTLVSLPDVYHQHGPLIPIHPRPSAAQFKAAVDPDYAETVAAGYVETPAQFSARTTPAPVPVLAGSVFTSPLEQRGFRRFLNTLKGKA
ncbi:phiSA1p31-related protein [Streptomyces sp. NPDC058378]|uniref:phiSA1p31-related protein n=1 Tax=Streptomyces sp. NPDC058378 TaxID=3346469 RepID=UPI0036588AC4